MINYVSETPVIAVIPPSAQRDRVDTYFYHPLFKDLDERITAQTKELTDIDSISYFITDGTHQTPTYVDEDNGILFLSATNINEDGLSLEKVKHIPRALHDSYSNCQPRVGDVMVAKNGKTGVACVFPEGIPECSIYVSIALIRLKEEWLPDFVSLLINSELGFLQIQRNQKGIGVKNLHLEDIRQIQIPKLDKTEQEVINLRFNTVLSLKKDIFQRICNIRKTCDISANNLIDNTYSIELSIDPFIKEKKEKIYIRNHLLTERLDIPANHPDYTKLVNQISKSSFSGTLSELVEVSEERFNPDKHSGEQINYLAIGDIDGMSGKIISPQIISADELPSRARRLINDRDILVGIAGASTGTDNMVIFPVTSEQSGWVASTGFLVLRPKEDVDIHYVSTLLKASFVLRQIRALLISPAMPTISESDLLAIVVPVTNAATRKETLSAIENIFSESRHLTKKLDDIGKQIQEILSDAKSNIFDLLDDEKFSAMSTRADELQNTMTQIEEMLQ